MGWRRWLPPLVRFFIALAVAIGIGRRFWLERDQLAGVFDQVQIRWLPVSAVLYISGLTACSVFWWWSLRDQGLSPRFLRTGFAYFAGHLGKYVPGKGLVVVIRAGLLRGSEVGIATGAVSCAQETLLMMATGSAAALLLLPLIEIDRAGYLVAAAAGMTLLLGLPSLPPAVAYWSRWITRPFTKFAFAAPYRARWPTVARGMLLIAGGWLLMGMSLGVVLESTGNWHELVARWGWWRSLALVTAIVALATVGGFLSFLPGGLGSREWIVVEALAPALGLNGTASAAVAALLLRVVWIVAELASTALFWLLERQWTKRRGVEF